MGANWKKDKPSEITKSRQGRGIALEKRGLMAFK
jgi:hypothetical protein